MARQRLIARGVDGHAAGSLLLGDVAGRIGGGKQLLEGAAFPRDLNEADRYANVEYLVLPDKAVVTHRTAHVIRDLPRLVQGASDEQHPNLATAQAGHRIAVAH